MLHFFRPHLRVDSVLELTVPRLRRMDLDALLLDVDCTLKNYRGQDVSAGVAAWLEELRQAEIGICLVSNGGGRRIEAFARRRGLPFVAKALKPLPFGCRAAIRKMGFDRHRTAMVGDQLFADVLAGRLARLYCILVKPIHPEEEPWYTRMKRILERPLLGGRDRSKAAWDEPPNSGCGPEAKRGRCP